MAPLEMRSGHDIKLRVTVDAGIPIEQIEAVTHQVDIERLAPHQARVTLTANDSIPNRDFVLRYRVAGQEMQSALLTHRDANGDGYFAYLVHPPMSPADVDVTPREVTFIIDSSGSMNGLPITMSKKVVRDTLASLRPFDRFNIIQFANGSSRLSEQVLANTEDNVARGLEYLETLKGAGGTQMLEGVKAYLETPSDPSYVRLVCFLTDGCHRQ